MMAMLFLLGACDGRERETRKPVVGKPPPRQEISAPDGAAWNVVVILIDTLRPDHLGLYGHDRPTSKNIDRLAERSFVFHDAFAPSPWTRPSAASLFVSRHVHEHGIASEKAGDRLRAEETTMAEVMSRLGYRTLGWYTNPHFRFGLEQGFQHHRYLPSKNAKEVYDEVLEELEKPQDRPFFLFVHNVDPHDVYKDHREFPFAPEDSPYRVVADRFPNAGSGVGKSCSNRDQADELDDEELDEMRACYDQEIAFTDHHLGRLLDRLEQSGLMQRTIVVVTADHGEEFLDHGSYWHGCTLYDELLRIPLVIYVPGSEGGHIRRTVGLVDVFPTLLDLLYPRALQGLELSGHSLKPLLEGHRPRTLAPPLYFGTEFRGAPRYGIRWLGYKLATHPDGTNRELFAPRNDPGETENLEKSAFGALLGEVLRQRAALGGAPAP